MSYINANEILPKELIDEIQRYVQGVNLYIPKIFDKNRQWIQKGIIREGYGNIWNVSIREHCLRIGKNVLSFWQEYLSNFRKDKKSVKCAREAV